MTLKQMEKLFEQYAEVTEEWDYSHLVLPSMRKDLCAMIKLDQLVPGEMPIISAGEHDMVYFEVEPEDLAKVVTEADIQYLVGCGVNFDGGLYMFV
jgi:hypothetical protein